MPERIGRITVTLVHRGPDSDGILVRAKEQIALGYRQLRDLSDAGVQPMSSPSGRCVTLFNGKI